MSRTAGLDSMQKFQCQESNLESSALQPADRRPYIVASMMKFVNAMDVARSKVIEVSNNNTASIFSVKI